VVGKPSTATRLLIPSTTSLGNFKSTLAVVNLAGTPASVQITARDNDGNVQTAHSVTIPGQGLLSEADIRASLNLAGTFGPLEIVSQDNKPLLAVSRVYSTQRTGGYFEGVAVSSSP
jgi:imidazoleglycerol phosphate synthase glutamine amidotransferase subunit HisH